MSESGQNRLNPLGLGLIGFGGFGPFIAEVFASMPQVCLRAVSDENAARTGL